jgi:hypothetical protein
MAVQLKFSGSELSETNKNHLTVFANSRNELYIKIDLPDNEFSFICLDKKTAVRFSREIRKEISYISNSEVDNG